MKSKDKDKDLELYELISSLDYLTRQVRILQERTDEMWEIHRHYRGKVSSVRGCVDAVTRLLAKFQKQVDKFLD